MPKEYEAKFLQIDIKTISKKLKEIGAKKIHGPTLVLNKTRFTT